MTVSKNISYEGREIFYLCEGSGEPVMLVHGFGEKGDVWNHQLDYLKEKYFLIVPDLPGSGRSAEITDMSMEGLAAVLKAVLDAESINCCAMIGHSMGGYVALAFVEQYPQYAKGLGLFHSSAFPDTEEKKAIRRKGISFIREHGGFEFLKTSIPNLFSAYSKDQLSKSIDEFIEGLSNFSGAALVSYYEAMMKRPDRTAILKNVKIPVLFILGEYDNAVPLIDGLKQSHLPEISYIELLENSGHMGMIEEHEKSNLAIENYLQLLSI
jgi:pimeloyl-ACP methyl ester carboxylesterase